MMRASGRFISVASNFKLERRGCRAAPWCSRMDGTAAAYMIEKKKEEKAPRVLVLYTDHSSMPHAKKMTKRFTTPANLPYTYV